MTTDARTIAEQTAEDGTRYRVQLRPDPRAEQRNPRTTDVPAGLVFVDARCGGPQETPSSLDRYALAEAVANHEFQVVARWLRTFHGATVVLPLLYRGPQGLEAGQPWEEPAAGRYAGVTFDTPLTLAEYFGPDAAVPPERIVDALAQDVDLYTAWAGGHVFGYAVQWAKLDPETGEVVRWVDAAVDRGFIGEPWAVDVARVALDRTVRFHEVDYPDEVGA